MNNRTLHNGVIIPAIGLGTHRVDEGGKSMSAVVEDALTCGYRMFDSAAGYGNEARLGSALREVGVPRKDLFLITKLDDTEQQITAAERAIERSLNLLQTDYIDLFLIHSPNSQRMRSISIERGYNTENYWAQMNQEAWSVMEAFHGKGILKSIGVSNFHIRHLEQLEQHCNVTPQVNQVKTCPGSLSSQSTLFHYCDKHKIQVMGYTPLGRGNALKHPEIQAIARKYEKTEAQIILRYLIQKGIIPIPRASSINHMQENFSVFDFLLVAEDCLKIEKILIPENWAMIKDPDTGRKYC